MLSLFRIQSAFFRVERIRRQLPRLQEQLAECTWSFEICKKGRQDPGFNGVRDHRQSYFHPGVGSFFNLPRSLWFLSALWEPPKARVAPEGRSAHGIDWIDDYGCETLFTTAVAHRSQLRSMFAFTFDRNTESRETSQWYCCWA